MKILVCGGRDYEDQVTFDMFMDKLSQELQRTVCIIQGECETGADRLARGWAAARALPCMGFRAAWERLGRSAGPIRNRWMVDWGRPDLVVAFPGGRGTRGMISLAEKAGIRVMKLGLWE